MIVPTENVWLGVEEVCHSEMDLASQHFIRCALEIVAAIQYPCCIDLNSNRYIENQLLLTYGLSLPKCIHTCVNYSA